jgi:DHA1 family tetracycline resistance protein-like MFS transporter
MSDRIGRLGLLRIWCIAYAAGILLVVWGMRRGLVESLFIARLPAASVPFFIILALCADIAKGPALLQSHGHVGSIMGASALIGSFGAGIIGRWWGNQGAMLTAFFFSLLAIAMAFMMRPVPQQRGSHANFIDSMRVVLRDPLLSLTVLSFSMVRVGNVNINVVYVLYAAFRFEWTILEVSFMLGIRGALAVYLQAAGTQLLARQPPKAAIKALHWLMFAHPLSMLTMGLAWDGTSFMFFSTLNTITWVAISILTSKVAALSHKEGIAGLALGAVGSLQNLIEIFAAIGFGWLLRYTVKTYAPTSAASGLPFYVNGLWYLLACGVLWFADARYGENRAGWRVDPVEDSDDDNADLPSTPV